MANEKPIGYAGFDINTVIGEVTNNQKNASDMVDDIFLDRGMGKNTRIRDLQFQGINHRQTGSNLPPVGDHRGHCFFVRPNLNLNYDNCRRDRRLARLLTNNTVSVEQWARITLDPFIEQEEAVESELVDNNNAFIPLLTNSLRTLTGVPSLVAGTYSSERGIGKEVFTMIDDQITNYDAYSVTASFRNMNGNPFIILFYSWILAASCQYLGKIGPRWKDRMQRRLNYTSRIYRVVLDHTQTFVTNIWAPVYCFPTTLETGPIFSYKEDEPLNQDTVNIDVTFQCAGSIFNDDLLIQQFNTTVMMANPMMADDSRNSNMIKIDKTEAMVLNYYGYPRINLETTELEWWVNKSIYNSAKEAIKKAETNFKVGEHLEDTAKRQEAIEHARAAIEKGKFYNIITKL